MAKKDNVDKEVLSPQEQMKSRPAPDAPVDNKGALIRKEKPKKMKARGKNMVENTDELSGKYEYVIKHKKVEKETKNRKFIRVLIIFLLSLLILGGGLWGVTAFIEYNNFRVVVDRPGQNIFAISPMRSLQNTTEIYNIDGPRYMDNITLMGMENVILEIEEADGATSRDNLIAATFYLTNITEDSRRYREIVDISETSQGLEEAIRIMLIKSTYNADGSVNKRVCNVYAAPHSFDEFGVPIPEAVVPLATPSYYTGDELRQLDGLGLSDSEDSEEWMSIPFLSSTLVLDQNGDSEGNPEDYIIPPGGKVKYTLLIWLEGNDKDCIDDKLGGRMKLSLTFSEG